MAERRMFALKIIDSDAFLDMPASTQNLYFHLSMRADDDGFISNPKKIMRMIGASEDDIEINAVNNAFQKATGYSFNEYGLTQISRLIKRYSLIELLEAIECLGFKFDPKKGDAIRFLNRLCQVEREKKECPYISDLYYIRGIIRNRFRDYERYQYYVIEYLKNVYGMGARLEEIKQVASTTSSWKEFTQYFSEVYE